MTKTTDSIAPLREFVVEMTRLLDLRVEEATLQRQGKVFLKQLISRDDWLPDFCAAPHPEYYQQYALYVDPLERLSVVSFVWGPGQRTPVHDHQTWGLIGMLRGSESSRRFVRRPDGSLHASGDIAILKPGDIDSVNPAEGDIHQVENAVPGEVSISIHVYGANIGAVRRNVFDPASGAVKPFVSGYSSDRIPNLWDRSAEVRASIR